MKKLTPNDVSNLGYGRITIMLNEKNQKIEEQEIVIRGINALLKTGNDRSEANCDLIEKQKSYIAALESEQKDYKKTTMRLREENKSQAAEIEKLKEENEDLKRLLKEQGYQAGVIQ